MAWNPFFGSGMTSPYGPEDLFPSPKRVVLVPSTPGKGLLVEGDDVEEFPDGLEQDDIVDEDIDPRGTEGSYSSNPGAGTDELTSAEWLAGPTLGVGGSPTIGMDDDVASLWEDDPDWLWDHGAFSDPDWVMGQI